MNMAGEGKDGGRSKVRAWVNAHPEVKRAYASLSENSKRSYYPFFKRYCDWIAEVEGRPIQPAELWEEPWEICRDRIIDFRIHLEEEGKAPMSVQHYTSCIRRFYEFNNILFKGKFFTNGTTAQPLEKNEKELITPQKLREILEISNTLERAMFMVQYQSGLAANEICHLKVKDVADVTEEGKVVKLRVKDGIVKLKLMRAKTKVKFTTFIGRDSVELLEKWIELRQRGKILYNSKAASDRARIRSGNDYLFVGYTRKEREWGPILPMTYAKYMRRRVRELGWITDDNLKAQGQMNVYRPHALRMSFSDRMKHDAKIGWDIVEHMLGHKFGRTDSAYVKFTDEMLEKAYREGEPYISLTPIESIVTDERYLEQEKKYAAQKDELEVMKAEMAEMKGMLARLAMLDDVLVPKIEKTREQLKVKVTKRL